MRRLATHKMALLWRALPALAVYALVLQAFLAGAAPAAPFDPERAPLCSEMAAGGGHPAPVHSGGECLCVATCAMPHAQVAMASFGADALPSADSHAITHSPEKDENARPADRRAGLGARGPPRG